MQPHTAQLNGSIRAPTVHLIGDFFPNCAKNDRNVTQQPIDTFRLHSCCSSPMCCNCRAKFIIRLLGTSFCALFHQVSRYLCYSNMYFIMKIRKEILGASGSLDLCFLCPPFCQLPPSCAISQGWLTEIYYAAMNAFQFFWAPIFLQQDQAAQDNSLS